MNEESEVKRQDETGVEDAAEKAAEYELRKLQGRLERLTLHVTPSEYRRLIDVIEDAEPVERLLECFIADLTDSDRSVWTQCHLEAQSWFSAHQAGQAMVEALSAKRSAEGGELC